MQPLASGDLDARKLFISSNLILPRSLNDHRLSKDKPFKLNTKYEAREYEIPSENLMSKKGRKTFEKRKSEHEDYVKKRKEEED